MRRISDKLLLCALATAGALLIGCGDGAASTTTGTGGAGGTATTGGSGGTGGTSTTGGTGGSGGVGGTGGTGGTGGIPAEWAVPACDSVTGTSAVTFTKNEGGSLAPTPGQLTGIGYTWGLAALDTPNTLLAEHKGELLRSGDAGCTWSTIATLEGAPLKLTAAPGGRAYAWSDNGAAFYRVDPDGAHPFATPAPNIVGVGVDPADGLHLRVGDATGTLHDSVDGGQTWTKHGAVAGSTSGLGYRFAFDPANLDHALFGQAVQGSTVTTDGGTTWTPSAGLGAKGANAFSLVVSPVDGNLVWAESLELGPDLRHIYRSTDGGVTFDPVVTEAPEITLINGTLLAPHPTNPDILYFVFGTGYADYGTDIYRYDQAQGTVTKTHNSYDEVSSIVASPADPAILYLGLTVENAGN